MKVISKMLLTLLWFLETSIACWTSGGTIMLLYTDLPFSFSNLALYSFCKTSEQCQHHHHRNCAGLWICFRRSRTPLTSLLISLLWAVSRVSRRVVNEPDCISFLLASLYLLWGIKSKLIIVVVIKAVLVRFKCFLPLMPEFAPPWHGGFEECP